MYRPNKLMFQQGGNKYNPNGYDVINEQMFNDIQRLNGNAPAPLEQYQENMSKYLSGQDLKDATKIANQRKKLAKQALPANIYNYLSNSNLPQVNRVVNPYTMVTNQQYQQGGMQETPQMEQQEQSGQEQQIMQMVAQALQQGQDPQQIMQMLVQQGIPQEQAQMIIQEVMAQMQGGQQQPQGQPMPQEGMPMQRMGGFRPRGLSYDY